MLKRYKMRFQKWKRYALKESYQHYPQSEGAFFVPKTLGGYFNDLRAKASFSGKFCKGVPVVRTDTIDVFFFPIVIFQWGLANWDLWLASGREDEVLRENVLAAARWAVDSASADGGWLCWTGLERPVISPYSAMAQGEAASLLVRAHSIEPSEGFLICARRAIAFMLEDGPQALIRDWGEWHSLEEYPGNGMPAVLNGWCFALMGIEDLRLADPSEQLDEACERFAKGLAVALSRFDMGFWSSYDLAGNVASPFYHDLHIAQLRTLARVFPNHAKAFLATADQFETYKKNSVFRAKAFCLKVWQKLLQPAVGEMD